MLAAERALGRDPQEHEHNHPGFDVTSFADGRNPVSIEVKGRVAGATDVIIAKNEVLIGKNKGADHRLALVAVHPSGAEHDQVRYLVDPVAAQPDPGWAVNKLIFSWDRLWEAAGPPC